MHVVPRKLKHILKQNLHISQNLIYLNNHLIKNNCLVSLEKLDSKDYAILLSSTQKAHHLH